MTAMGHGPKCSHRADVVRCSSDSRTVVASAQKFTVGPISDIHGRFGSGKSRFPVASMHNREDDSLDWWPSNVQALFAAVGRAIGEGRLHPTTLEALPKGFGSILPGHQMKISHIPAKELGRRRKGQYRILVSGPAFGGGWHFSSGKLERLSRLAAHKATSAM
jgi:hypothetical protein